jgi:hypothetical protein
VAYAAVAAYAAFCSINSLRDHALTRIIKRNSESKGPEKKFFWRGRDGRAAIFMSTRRRFLFEVSDKKKEH